MKDVPKKKGANARKGPKLNTVFKEESDAERVDEFVSESDGELGGSVHAQSAGEDDEVGDSKQGIDLRGKSLKNTQKKQPSEPRKPTLPLKAILKQILEKPTGSNTAIVAAPEAGMLQEKTQAEVETPNFRKESCSQRRKSS